MTDTAFHHVAVTKNGSNVVFYADGVADPAVTYNPTFLFTTSPAIGGLANNAGSSFLGEIDEVSVYNRALGASEIQSIFNAGSAGKCMAIPPKITAALVNGNLILSWPASDSGFNLESTDDLTTPNWTGFGGSVTTDGITDTATIPISGTQQFYRLHHP